MKEMNMEQRLKWLVGVNDLPAREYFMILRLAIYHTDHKYLEPTPEVATYPKHNKIYECAYDILCALVKKEK